MDTTLPTVQVIDLLAVGLGFTPLPDTVLELHRENGAPRYACRAEYHFDSEELWDVAGLDFAEVLKTAKSLGAELRIDLVPDTGWLFEITAEAPDPSAVDSGLGRFLPAEANQPLFHGGATPRLFQAFQDAKAGKNLAPQLQSALLRDGLGEELARERPFTAEGLIHNYLRLCEEDLVFPWFGLAETFVLGSERSHGPLELVEYLLRQGSIKLLKNGRIAVADTRELVRESEFFRAELELAYAEFNHAGDLGNSDQVPMLRESLDTLLETRLVRRDGQQLTLSPEYPDGRTIGNEDSYRRDQFEVFIAEVRSGRIAEDALEVGYPLPGHILKPHPEATFTPTPQADDLVYDNYVDEETVRVFVAALSQGARVVPSSARERELAASEFMADLERAFANPAENPSEFWSPDDADDLDWGGFNVGDVGPRGGPELVPDNPFSGGFGSFLQLPEQLDESVLPGRRSGEDHHDFSREVRHIEFEIALNDVSPRVSRVMQLPVALDAATAMQLIIVLFGWELSHLYDLSFKRLGSKDHMDRIHIYPRSPELEPLGDHLWGDDVELGQILVPGGPKVKLNYDYGDSWGMVLKPRKTVTRDAGAHIQRAARACPPEDVGGPGGYQQIREILSKGAAQAATDDEFLDRDWATELEDIFAGFDADTPQFGTGTYPLEVERLITEF